MSTPDITDVTIALSQLGINLSEEIDPGTITSIDPEVIGPLYYVELSELNLNALAIGLGLEDVEYEPEVFPGLVYRPKEDCVICLFKEGVITTWTAADRSTAVSAIQNVCEGLIQLGLSDIDKIPEVRSIPLS